MSETIKTDVLIVGAGPLGLFAVFGAPRNDLEGTYRLSAVMRGLVPRIHVLREVHED